MNPRTGWGKKGGKVKKSDDDEGGRRARIENKLTRLGSTLRLVHRHQARDDSNSHTSDDSTDDEGSERSVELQSDSEGEDGGRNDESVSSSKSITKGLRRT